MPKTFFITTAIYYTNSSPHVGHAYEKVLADVIARYHRLKGEKVFFLTGVDQHGQKVQQSAAKAGVPPAEFVKGITQKWVDLWKKLDVQYDDWAETTSDRHKKVVQGILQRLFDEGQIYKDKQVRLLLRSSGTILNRQRTRSRRPIRSGVGGDRISRRRKLLFQAKPAQRVAASVISTIEQTQSFPIFVKRNCATRSRKSAATFASRVRNRGSTGESNCRSTTISSPTSGSTP